MQKRIISAVLFLIMVTSLCACGRENDADQQMVDSETDLIDGWIAEAIPIPEDINGWNGMTEDYSLSGGIIYFGMKKNGYPAIISYDTQNGSWSEITYDTSGLSDLTRLRGLSVSDGVLWAQLCNYPEYGDAEFSLLICELSQGHHAQRISIPFQAEPDPEGNRPMFSTLYALDKETALLCDYSNAYIINRKGEKVQTISLNGYWANDCARVNGDLYFYGNEGQFKHFDRENGRFSDSFIIDTQVRSESENGHVFSRNADRTVFAYDVLTGETTKLFNWMDVALDADSLNTNKLIETASGDCYYLGRNYLGKVSRAMLKQKTELKMLCFMEDEEYIPDDLQGAGQYMDAILYFNNTNPDYKISVTTICSNKEDMTKNLIQLATSANYDLIDTGILPDGALDSSLLTDLLPYLDSDPEISREDFIPNVFEGMLRGGKLYTITPYVQIITWGMSSDDYPGKNAWTTDYAEQLIAARGNEQVFFWTKNRDMLAKMLTRISTAEFVDFNQGVCNFTDGRFAQWLELLKNIPYSDSYSEARCLFDPTFEIRADTPFSIKQLVQSENYCFAGFPGASGSGHYFARVGQNMGQWVSDPSSNVSMGIMETSQHKDAAWCFLKILLQQNNGAGFPVLTARLDKQLNALVTDEEVRGYMSFTAEDADKLRELVNATDKTVCEDQQLIELISGVIQDFLAGRYSAEEAAANLQSRASIYIAEQYG